MVGYVCNGTWSVPFYNFDNIQNAMLVNVVMATQNGWSPMMYSVMDASGVMSNPKPQDNIQGFWYFFLGVMFFGFYLTNLLIGIVFESFLRDQSIDQRGRVIEHRHWVQYEKRLRGVQPLHAAYLQPQYHPFRKRLVHWVESPPFEWGILLVLVVNAIILAVQHDGQTAVYDAVLSIGNYVCTTIFIVEMIITLAAYGMRTYWTDVKKSFDGAITIISTFDLILVSMDFCQVRNMYGMCICPPIRQYNGLV